MKRLTLFACSILLALQTYAQSEAKESWQTDLGSIIYWQKVSSFGQLVVQTSDGLKGIDASTGNTEWSNPGVLEGQLQSWHEIPGTPFLRLSTGTNTLIVDLLTGKTVLNAFDQGIENIEEEVFLPTYNALAIGGETKGKYGFWLVDLNLPKVKWKKTNFESPVAEIAPSSDNGILLATPLRLYHFDLNNGEEKWQRYIDPDVEKQMKMLGSFGSSLLKTLGAFDMTGVKLDFIELDKNRYALGYQSKTETTEKDQSGEEVTKVEYNSGYTFFNLSDGSSFAEDISSKGVRGILLKGHDGLIVSYRGTWGPVINKLDLNSRKMLWGKKGKGNKLKGQVVESFPAHQGILLSMTKEPVPDENTNYYFNVLDPGSGELLFDKNLKVKEQVRFMKKVEAGVLVVTTEEVTMIDLKKQDFFWDDGIEGTHPGLVAFEDNKLYVFSVKNGFLYKVNLKTGYKKKISSEKLKFKKGEDPKVLEIRPEGFFLGSDQNIALIGKEGNLIYHEVYEAPRLPGLMRILAAANAVRAAYIGAAGYAAVATIENAQEEYSNELNEFENAILEGTKEVYGELGEAGMNAANEQFARVTARFKATKAGNDHVYMLTKGADKMHHLLRVSKSTGKPDLYVNLGDDVEPVYDVDPIVNRIFYRPNGSTLTGYTFN